MNRWPRLALGQYNMSALKSAVQWIDPAATTSFRYIKTGRERGVEVASEGGLRSSPCQPTSRFDKGFARSAVIARQVQQRDVNAGPLSRAALDNRLHPERGVSDVAHLHAIRTASQESARELLARVDLWKCARVKDAVELLTVRHSNNQKITWCKTIQKYWTIEQSAQSHWSFEMQSATAGVQGRDVTRLYGARARNKFGASILETKVFQSKCVVLKKVLATFLGLFGTGGIVPSFPPLLCPWFRRRNSLTEN